MLSLRRLFEVLGAQLTPRDAALLSFLLDQAPPWGSGTPPDALDAPLDLGGPPRPPQELLLELERRGLCDEGNLGNLLRLLRRLRRHDLLRFVTLRRPRPVSPERNADRAARERRGERPAPRKRLRPRRRTHPPLPHPAPPPLEPPPKVTCDVRLRVRAELSDPESVLRRSVGSSRPRGLGRELDIFGQASGVLKSRDLGSILCDIKFSELAYLEAFWGDYVTGALGEALRGVFLGGGPQDVRLLVSVDQDDYEAGRRLLLGAGRH
ncbi:DNA-binding death effector domain-containing protein 2-like [Caloenas nicobarica]